MKFITLIATLTFILSSHLVLAQTLEANSIEYRDAKLAGTLSEFEIIPSQVSIAMQENSLNYPSSVLNNDCECWIEPDATYTLSEFGASGTDDGSTQELDLPFDFDFFGEWYTQFWINTNGNITFTGPHGTFTSSGFPNPENMLAPFWADVDFGCDDCGELFYKITDDAVYVNWVNVGYFNNQSEKLNSFQVIFTANASAVLADNANVQFCYKNMEWTTGDASQGEDGLDGIPATVGANSGNNVDYLSFGRFNQAGVDYEGPSNEENGVGWLEDRSLGFNVGFDPNENVPPILVSENCLDTVVLCTNSEIQLEFEYVDINLNQQLTLEADIQGYEDLNLESDFQSGYTKQSMTIGSSGTVGEYDMSVTATDNGTPVLSTTKQFILKIINQEAETLDLVYEGETVDSLITACFGTLFSELEVESAISEIQWSNGASGNSQVLESGEYTVSGNDSNNCAVSKNIVLLENPPFNINAFPEELVVCENGTTIITVPETPQLENIEWSVFQEGSIVDDTDLENVVVTPGIYQILAENEHGCPGSMLVPVLSYPEVENLNEIPTAICNENEVEWNTNQGVSNSCFLQYNMSDSESDTWEGAFIEVIVNGIIVSVSSIETNASFMPDGLSVFHGDLVEFSFSPGLDDEDIELIIFNAQSNIVFNTDAGDNLSEGVFFALIVNCGFDPIAGNWSVESDSDLGTTSFGNESVFGESNSANSFEFSSAENANVNLIFEDDFCGSVIEFPLEITFVNSSEISTVEFGIESIDVLTGDSQPDLINIISSNEEEFSTIVLVDENEIILEVIETEVYDLDALEEGEYTIVQISHSEPITEFLGQNINEIDLGCHSFSNNLIVSANEIEDSISENLSRIALVLNGREITLSGVNGSADLKAYDVTGKQIELIRAGQNTYRLQSTLAQGFYVFKVQIGNQLISKKLFVSQK